MPICAPSSAACAIAARGFAGSRNFCRDDSPPARKALAIQRNRLFGEVVHDPLFPTCGTWPKDKPIPIPCLGSKKAAVLTQKLTLPNGKDAEGRLPKVSEHSLPRKGVLEKPGKTLPSSEK